MGVIVPGGEKRSLNARSTPSFTAPGHLMVTRPPTVAHGGARNAA
ncbi:hypothetical protein [Streptomyces sp. SLBN-31]|nr:hypothetical protein [Streptomyces sp. SLBN-31]